MSFSFRSNLSSNNIITQLARTSGNLSNNFERLSSGLRINRASDDAAGLALASSLSVDARVFTQGIRNVNDGISLANMAESALTELQNITNRQAELANQAANGTFTHSQRQALNSEASALVDEFNRIVNTTEFNGVKLLDNSFGTSSVQAEGGSNGAINFTLASDLARTMGNGTFQTTQTATSGTSGPTQSVATSDFNGDGYADIVATNYGDGTASVFLSNGNGTFASRVTYAVGGGASSQTQGVKVGDVNNDGNVDIIVANRGVSDAGFVSVMLGNGSGTFAAARTYASGGASSLTFNVDLADFNGDGYNDIVSANFLTNTASVFLNNKDGTFAANVTYALGASANPYTVATGDFNNDGKVDLVAANYGNDTVDVLIGNGDGTFRSAVSYALSTTTADPRSVKTGDINRDGYIDLVVADAHTAERGTSSIDILLGNANGTFQTVISIATPTSNSAPSDLALIDMNGDGYLDIVSANQNDNKIAFYFGNGNGTFASPVTFTAANAFSVAVGDFNNDGALDVVSANNGTTTINTMLANTTTKTTMEAWSLLTQADARTAITTISNTQNRITKELGKVAGSQSRFESAVNLLRNKRENYETAVSRIQDVDVASEFADMVRNQILQQTQRALLAQSNNLTAKMVSVLLNIKDK